MDIMLRKILQEFPKFSVDKQKSPSYVEMFSKHSQDVVMIYLKNKPTGYNDINKKNLSPDKEEFELTGSPLKLDLSLHTILDETLPSDEPQLFTKEEIQHLPISLEKAREIANTYNHALREQLTEDITLPMWLLCTPTKEHTTMLLMAHSNKDQFIRGMVNFEGTMLLEDIDIGHLVEEYAKQEGLSYDAVLVDIDCRYILSGASYSNISRTMEELVNSPSGSLTELHCAWPGKNIQTPIMTCKVNFEQEVVIGHLASPCHSLWKSIYALQRINQILVDMTAAGASSLDLQSSLIRHEIPGAKRTDTSKCLKDLLSEVESYVWPAQWPAGGCVCITEDTRNLSQCLQTMNGYRASNDFVYTLYDVLKESSTAEELITLLIKALKFVASGNKPFIDANNKTYLSKLVLKLSRGHSQASKVLKNLRSNPAQALSLVAQVGVEKTMWEYTQIMSLVEHSFFVANIWTQDVRTHESIEQINQTIQDMTMSGGDFSLNPFESLSNTAEHSIRLDCESFYDDDPNELSVDEFASLKKHGLVSDKDKKVPNEVPLIADEIDITPWKNLLMKFAQVHVCLEHLHRAETCLRADFVNLKPLASKLLEHYVSERSPVKTVGQLISDPVQKISLPVTNNIVKDHLKKPVAWYRAELSRKDNTKKNLGFHRDVKVVYAFTQQPVFPPSVWQHIEPQSEDVAESTTVGEELKYHCTKYTRIVNKLPNKLPL